MGFELLEMTGRIAATAIRFLKLSKVVNVLGLGWVIASTGGAAWAAERTSAHYAIVADTLDTGGQATSSAVYTHVGSLGAVGGASETIAPPTFRIRHGYLGQIPDVQQVVLAAESTSLNENQSRQIEASLLYDDATWLPLRNQDLRWQAASGPITLSDPQGQFTAGIVYRNTPVLVSGSYQGDWGNLSLTVVNSEPDNFGFYAGDGLPDDWQVYYFGLNQPQALAPQDPDADLQSNLFEYIAGLVPTNGASRFELRIDRMTNAPNQRAISFAPRYGNRMYEVEYQPVLTEGFQPLTGYAILDAGEERTVVDQTATDATRFYRVKIALPQP